MPTVPRQLSIAISRSAIACAACLGAAAIGVPGCSVSTSPTALTASAVAASEGQSALAGNPLPLPLRVRVQSDGTPKAGVMVTWQASAGTISPDSSLTDVSGEASATWTLGSAAGSMTASTTVAGAQGSPVTFHATALTLPPTRASIVPASNGQSGIVGTILSQPLQLQVYSNGAPKSGVTVRWRTGSGSVSPETSVSDGDGIASTTWTLGTASGFKNADAAMEGFTASQVFWARALPGPAVAIATAFGSGQASPANHGPFSSLTAKVTDRYGNGIEGEPVTWTIKSGPVAFVTVGDTTDATGQTSTIIKPTGTLGKAVVRAAVPGVSASADFALTISPPTYDVTLHLGDLWVGPYMFVSSQNGSKTPAVDTIPAGATMTWTLVDFDYGQHGVKSVGIPSFKGKDFAYTALPTVRVTFTTPGTYSYNDPYQPTATGVVVVR